MQKIVIAITGASGSVYSRQLLTKLQQLHQYINEVSVVVTENAKQVWETELGENFTVPEGTRSFSNTPDRQGFLWSRKTERKL